MPIASRKLSTAEERRGTVLRTAIQAFAARGYYGTTTVEGTTSAGESGSILYASRLSVEREIRANLTGTAILGADWRDYVGSNDHDLTLSAEAGLTWWVNRYVGLTTRARHERLKSSLPNRDATTNSIFVARLALALAGRQS